MPRNTLQLNFSREWILTNGLGGYALGFGDMINKRKYNGILIASFDDMKRIHIVSSIEEKVASAGNSFYIDSNHYPNCVYPEGYDHIVKSFLRPYPCVLYSTSPSHENFLIFKELFMVQGENAVVVKYTNFGKEALRLTLRPKFTLRGHHELDPQGVWDRTPVETEVSDSSFRFKRLDNGIQVFGYVGSGYIIEEKVIYRSVYYPTEAWRGYAASEDLIAPLRLDVSLQPKESCDIVFSTEFLQDPHKDAKSAEKYYKGYPLPAGQPEREKARILLEDQSVYDTPFSVEEYKEILRLAAGDFLAKDDIVAGYPWFGAWGRDAMISLAGLKYLYKDNTVERVILRRYGKRIKEGLLPNVIGEGGVGSNYDSIDAPLWFVLRCFECDGQDREFFECASQIVMHYMNDADKPFVLEGDGLLAIREGAHALTWMDAKIYGQPVTPRWGKAVEINALWYNAICAVIEMAGKQKITHIHSGPHDCSLAALSELKHRVKSGLEKFRGEDYFSDRIFQGKPVWEVRPNAVIALSLPFEWADNETRSMVWRKAKKELLTPYGLRSLSVSHPAFKQKYIGNEKQRDLAYHQGTVWAYLLLPFAILTERVFRDNNKSAELEKELTSYVWEHRNSFMNNNRASVAEIWDGIDPKIPKGCPAQAWSVFALLAIEAMIDKCKGGVAEPQGGGG